MKGMEEGGWARGDPPQGGSPARPLSLHTLHKKGMEEGGGARGDPPQGGSPTRSVWGGVGGGGRGATRRGGQGAAPAFFFISPHCVRLILIELSPSRCSGFPRTTAGREFN